jgi:hypothetical protein
LEKVHQEYKEYMVRLRLDDKTCISDYGGLKSGLFKFRSSVKNSILAGLTMMQSKTDYRKQRRKNQNGNRKLSLPR